jgi:hypothetical protein
MLIPSCRLGLSIRFNVGPMLVPNEPLAKYDELAPEAIAERPAQHSAH